MSLFDGFKRISTYEDDFDVGILKVQLLRFCICRCGFTGIGELLTGDQVSLRVTTVGLLSLFFLIAQGELPVREWTMHRPSILRALARIASVAALAAAVTVP